MKKIKSTITIILAAMMLMMVSLSLTACGGRSRELRIYNWGYYMCPSVLESFEEWYHETTGRRIRVIETTFTSNEEMFADISSSMLDFDIAVPSEYMVSKMFGNGGSTNYLLPIYDPAWGDDNIVTNLDSIYDRLMNVTNAMTPNDGGRIYATPYLWGTMGIMFDSSVIRYEYVEFWGWTALFRDIPTHTVFNPNASYGAADYGPVALTQEAIDNNSNLEAFVANRIYMKDSFRDSLVAVQGHLNRTRLRAYAAESGWGVGTPAYNLLRDIYANAPTPARIAEYEAELIRQRNLRSFKQHEVDVGKTNLMHRYESRGFLGIFWSCDGYVITENPNIVYHIPIEGSNMYVDAMVIPRFARNERAARYFIYYINKYNAQSPATSAAFRNMTATGAPSGVEQSMIDFRTSLNLDDGVANIFGYTMEDLFEDYRVGDRPTDMLRRDMYTNVVLFPHLYEGEDILARTQYMRDWGASVEHALALMWSRVLVS
ncbi:MAG: hypothetical protein FWC80_06650 [Firmicutes bacterium]|nr:hypothetical protein [Bacillota bacterium]